MDTETHSGEDQLPPEIPVSSLTIALDYDGTYTADPGLWQRFILEARKRGHRVFIVTCRMKECEIHCESIPKSQHVYTNMAAKQWYCESVLGMNVDIWIDDSPKYITECR